MCLFTHDDRQSIVNRIYIHFVVKRHPTGLIGSTEGYDCYHRKVKSAIGVFGSSFLDGIPGSGIADKNANCPEAITSLFKENDMRRLDNDDVAFLIDLEAEHVSAVINALPYQRFHSPRPFDTSFRDEISYRLNRFAINEGLKRPASALSARWP